MRVQLDSISPNISRLIFVIIALLTSTNILVQSATSLQITNENFETLTANICSANLENWFGAENANSSSLQISDVNEYSSFPNSAIHQKGTEPLICDDYEVNSPIELKLGFNGFLYDMTEGRNFTDLLLDNQLNSLQLTENQEINKNNNKIELLGPNVAEASLTYDPMVAQFQISNDKLNWQPVFNLSETQARSNIPFLVDIPEASKYTQNIAVRIIPLINNEAEGREVLIVNSLFLVSKQAQNNVLGDSTNKVTSENDKTKVEISEDKVVITIKTKRDNADNYQNTFDKLTKPNNKNQKPKNFNVVAEVSDNGLKLANVNADWLEVDVENYDIWRVDVDRSKLDKPGKYDVTITITEDSQSRTIKQDFTWGVLALNTNKDSFRPNENMNLAFAVLDETGEMDCNADLTLKMTGNGVDKSISTASGEIKTNDECKVKAYTENPDYSADWIAPDKNGIYQLELTASTANGSYKISDKLIVDDSPQFVISRVSPTRIYPPVIYPVKLIIEVNSDFEGKLVEFTPSEFVNSDITDLIDVETGEIAGKQINNYNENQANSKSIAWDAILNKGRSYEASYKFKAPNISPEYWLLGRSQLKDINNIATRVENRYWQIASDALGYIDPNGDGTTLGCTPTPTGTQFTTIDEATRQPTAPSTTDFINCPATGSATNSFFNMSTISPITSVSALRVWVYHRENAANMSAHVGVTQTDETTYIGALTTLPYSATYRWDSVLYSGLNLNQATLDALKLQLGCIKSSGGPNNSCDIAASYIEVTYTSSNTAPNAPSSLAQTKTDDTSLSTGNWTNQSSVKFTANATDPDNPDSLQLCVEIDPIGTAFSNTEDSCGSLVAYSGTAVAVNHTIGSLVDGTEYHWQARIRDSAGAYSSWVSYGGNAESARDVGVDTSAPSGGTVYDGTTTDVDVDFNNGSLDTLSANWSAISTAASGLSLYEYSIGTSAGATDIVGWTANGTTASVTVGSLSLNTSSLYFFNVRTTDNAGNVSTAISSDGLRVSPTLTFSTSPGSVVFDNLNSGNNHTSTKTTTLTTSTNAYNGYVIRAYTTGLLTSLGLDTINFFDGGTYAAPDEWLVGDYGYGYTSNDNDIQGTNKFNPATCAGGGSAPCYVPFTTAAPGDIVADHTLLVTGIPITNENFIITHRVTTTSTQPAGTYTSEVIYVINAIY